MKVSAHTEIHLWNQNVDRLVRVRQRLELHSIRSKRELKAYAIRLEEIRAGLKADFSEEMAARERAMNFASRVGERPWKDKRRGRTKLLPLRLQARFLSQTNRVHVVYAVWFWWTHNINR